MNESVTFRESATTATAHAVSATDAVSFLVNNESGGRRNRETTADPDADRS